MTIRTCRDGGMERLVAQYGGMLEGVCARILSDRALAQDAVQETFLKAYLKGENFRGESEGSERAWLIRIAVNVCRDQQRTGWFRFVDGRIPLEEMEPSAPGMGEEAVLLRAVIGMLPEKYRAVIVMHYYQDMTAEEIARVVCRSPDTVYRHLREARELLGGMLREGAQGLEKTG